MTNDTAFEMAASSIRLGPGVTREVGCDLADLGVKHALVLTDPTLRALAPVHRTEMETQIGTQIRRR
jgi:hydroxyacid-oxoacid transhydrogenase